MHISHSGTCTKKITTCLAIVTLVVVGNILFVFCGALRVVRVRARVPVACAMYRLYPWQCILGGSASPCLWTSLLRLRLVRSTESKKKKDYRKWVTAVWTCVQKSDEKRRTE